MSVRDVVVAKGDGAGPEITNATLGILKELAGSKLSFHEVLIGQSAFDAGYPSGIEDGALEKIEASGILLKAPTETPKGGGHKSLNVQLRQTLDLWANVRPAVSLPYVRGVHDNMDMTIFRENSEGLYLGLGGDIDKETYQKLADLLGRSFTDLGYAMDGSAGFAVQIISDKSSQRIIDAAFKFASRSRASEVVGMSKPNIMKNTDGRFMRAFNEAQVNNFDVKSRFEIVDIGFAKLAAYPVHKGVVVTENLYGDIFSDMESYLAQGTIGTASSLNLGGDVRNPKMMVEAVHGTAPDIAGKDLANPSALLISSVMMMNSLGLQKEARALHNALMKTWEDGLGTQDMLFKRSRKWNVLSGSVPKHGTLTTRQFTSAVMNNLGGEPKAEFLPSFAVNDYTRALPEPEQSVG